MRSRLLSSQLPGTTPLLCWRSLKPSWLQEGSLLDPWAFSLKEGDVRRVAHIINLTCEIQLTLEDCREILWDLESFFHCLATMQTHNHSKFATVLDPRYNLRAYEVLMPNSSLGVRRQRVSEQFEEVWLRYAGRQQDLDAAAFREAGDSEFTAFVREPYSDDDMFSGHTAAAKFEGTRWYKEKRVSSDTDLLKFWSFESLRLPYHISDCTRLSGDPCHFSSIGVFIQQRC